MTTQEATRGEEAATQWSVNAQRADGIGRAGRVVPTTRLTEHDGHAPEVDRGEQDGDECTADEAHHPSTA